MDPAGVKNAEDLPYVGQTSHETLSKLRSAYNTAMAAHLAAVRAKAKAKAKAKRAQPARNRADAGEIVQGAKEMREACR